MLGDPLSFPVRMGDMLADGRLLTYVPSAQHSGQEDRMWERERGPGVAGKA